MRIGLTYNLRKNPADAGLPEDHYIEFDDEATVEAIADALAKGGHNVIQIEADENALSKLTARKPDAVFNIAEGETGGCREARIPAMLEMLRIPYTGSGPLTMAVALDKALTNDLLRFHGINTPSHQVFYTPDEALSPKLSFPLIVKPIHEGSSKGIRDGSLVRGELDLVNRISWITKTYRQPALVEEYIDGREFTAALLGNRPTKVLPIVELDFEQLPSDASKIYSYEAKWIWDTPEKPIDLFVCPARIDNALQARLSETARAAFHALNCQDVCRIDMRLDNRGRIRVLDVNPLPGLIPDPTAHSCLPEAARAAGYRYEELINGILHHALARHGLPRLLPEAFRPNAQ